jgi:hypothetical protein
MNERDANIKLRRYIEKNCVGCKYSMPSGNKCRCSISHIDMDANGVCPDFSYSDFREGEIKRIYLEWPKLKRKVKTKVL